MNEVSRIAPTTVLLRGEASFCLTVIASLGLRSFPEERRESNVARNTNTFTVAGAVRTTLWSLPGRRRTASHSCFLGDRTDDSFLSELEPREQKSFVLNLILNAEKKAHYS